MSSRVLLAAACAAALAAACGSDPNRLSSGDGVGVPQGGAGSGTTPGGGTTGTGTPDSNGAQPAPPAPADNTPPPGVTDNAAKAYFVQTVYPSLMGTCGACHAPPGSSGAPVYLSKTSASDAYTSMEGRGYIAPASMLLKKGAHEGPALTAEQFSTVTHWIELEQQVRGSQAPVNLLEKLGSCVDPAKFQAIALNQLKTIKRQGENNNCTGCNAALCQTCHEQGEYGMHSNFSQQGQTTVQALQANATSPQGVYLISKYVTTNGTQLVPATGLQDKAKVTQTGAPYSHPMFQVSATMDAAITAFAQDIITKYNAKQCGQ